MNYPPYIDPDFVRPERDVLRLVTPPEDGVLRLSVETFLDPNAEEVLYYAWIGKRLGLIEQAEVDRNIEQTTLFRDIFYQFGRVEVEIDVCSERLRGVESETIWIIVADRRFARITGDGVTVEPGGFVDSHAWVLEFSPALCAN